MPVDFVHIHDYLGAMDDDFDLCMVLNTRMAARAVTRRADAKMRAFGITSAQLTILGSLRSHPGRSVTEMAESIAMDRTTLSRNLALLERYGLVTTAPAARGNTRIGSVTQKGDTVIDAALPEWRKAQAELREHLSAPDFDTMIAGLRQLSRV